MPKSDAGDEPQGDQGVTPDRFRLHVVEANGGQLSTFVNHRQQRLCTRIMHIEYGNPGKYLVLL